MTFAEWRKKQKEEEEKAALTAREKAMGAVNENSSEVKTNAFAEWRKKQLAETNATEDIAPVAGGKKDTWFKSGGFSDGVDGVGDFFGDLGQTTAGTVGDVILGATVGFGRMFEGLYDLGVQGVSRAADALGADEFAESAKEHANRDLMGEWAKDKFDYVDQYSVLGDKSDSVAQGLGQVGGIILTGNAGAAAGLGAGGVSALTTATTGLSSMGTNIGEAYKAGATDGQAFVYGLTTGAIEAGTELFFGGLGKGVKALGLSRGIGGVDDMLAKGLSNKITKLIAKDSVKKVVGNTIEALVKATGEGVEEVASGLGSALMKKLTYASKEDWEKLVADEKLLESFIVGAVTSGIMQGGDYVKANANKTDFVTGRTSAEEKVIQRAAEKEIAQKEANGEKLTKKQKNEIYDRLAEDISRGYISIDTIEEALGGDKYTEYKKASDENATLKKELDELRTLSEYDSLRNMKSGDRTDIQNDRLAELKGKNLSDMTEEQKSRLAELETKYGENTKTLEDMKKQMSDDVLNLVKSERKGKGSLLMESYNEKTRRGEGYTVDLNTIDSKKQDTYKRAMDAGILNNTNRTHDFVDLIATLESERGVKIDFVNNQKLKESGFAVDGAIVNGVKTDNGILLNVESAKSLDTVVGHEIAYVLEGTELYQTLQDSIIKYAQSKGDYDTRYANIAKLYKTDDDVKIKQELTADLVGDYLFADEKFIKSLTTNPNVFKKVFNEIKYLVKIATSGSEAKRKLLEVQRAFERAWADTKATKNTTNEGGVNANAEYSLSKNARDDVHNALYNKTIQGDIKLTDNSPTIMLAHEGVKNLPMLMKASHIRENVFTEAEAKKYGLRINPNINYHGLGEDLFLEIVDDLDNVTEAYRGTKNAENSDRRENYFLLISKKTDKDGNVINVPVYINEKGQYNRVFVDTNKIATVYGKSELRQYINEQLKAKNLVRIKTRSTQASESTSPIKADYGMDASVDSIPQNSEKSRDLEKISENSDLAPTTIGQYSLSSADTQQADADYAYAVERGDTETAQRMVDEAAKRAGYEYHLYHGTNADFTKFDLRNHGGKNGKGEGYGIYLAANRDISAPYGKNVINSYTKFNRLAEGGKKTLSYDEVKKLIQKSCELEAKRMVNDGEYDSVADAIKDTWVSNYVYTYDYSNMAQVYTQVANILWEGNDNDGDIINEMMASSGAHYDYNNALDFYENVLTPTTGIDGFHYVWGNKDGSGEQNDIYLAFSSEQIKSADPVTYDDNGNVIPLSERFNEGEQDIRYSLSAPDDIAPVGKYTNLGIQEDIAPLTMDNVEAPTSLNSVDNTVGGVDSNQTVSERIAAHRDELRAELDELIKQRKFDAEDIDIDIAMAEAEYKNIKNKKSDKANNLLQEIKRLEKMKATVDSDYKKRIDGLQQRINKLANMSDVGTQEMYVDPVKKEHKKANWWNTLRTHVLDDASVFEDLAKKTKNRELEAKFNFTKSAKARAQSLIGNGKKDAGIKSLTSIREAVEKTGKTAGFEDYMYHLLNIDRMTLEDRYEGATNKPVFDNDVTADISAAKVRQYEAQNPQFKQLADDVYKFVAYERQLMVDNGIISQETADLWQEQTPHYIPIKRSVADEGFDKSLYPDKKVKVDSVVKRAKGGDQPIEHLFDTIASRTERVYDAIAKNNFGLELKNTLNTVIDSNVATQDDVDNGVDRHDDLLQAGKEGRNPTFTVFENGEKVTFEISHDMYEALKPTDAMWKGTSKVMNKINNIRRGLLTEYSPAFMVSNPVKDTQDVLFNSQHALKTYKNFPKAIKELKTKGKWFTEYIENGGEQNSYFEKGDGFKKDDTGIKKLVGIPLNAISDANNFIERIPRLAEYIASRENGASIETAMLDAARVTTNFQAGGDITKFFNRNGFTFLNASVQGLMQNVRNIREAKMNGLKGVMQLVGKTLIAGLPALIANHLLWGDDEEYEELSDYVKDNYYIIAKYGDGTFVRIPKGRTAAVVQDAFEQMANLITGNDEVDLESFFELVMNNLAPNNPLENNIIAPLTQAWSNTTWYGDDLVPTRLQDLPAGEQYDESIDAISKWLGEKTNISPYKINYVLDQYSGAVGDFVLPMLTPEAERGEPALLAPLADKFTTDSTMKNQNVSDFYDTVDKLSVKANSSKATDDDILKSKYMSSINSELSELYKRKREIQNSTLPNSAKYDAVREVQKQINDLAKQSLDTYDEVYINGEYASVGNRHYHKNPDGEWQKITDEQLEKMDKVTKGLGISASEYWANKKEYDFAYEYSGKYEIAQKVGGYDKYMEYQEAMKGMTLAEKADYVGGLDLTTEQKNALINGETTRKEPIDMAEYGKYSSLDEMDFAKKNPEKYAVTKAVGGYSAYTKYSAALSNVKGVDNNGDGRSDSGTRKTNVINYLNDLDIPYGVKIILYRNEYNGDDTYNYDIVKYLEANESLTYQEKIEVLVALGMTVDAEGNVSW